MFVVLALLGEAQCAAGGEQFGELGQCVRAGAGRGRRRLW
jgi:hypothetical protein